jgi:hypothetical protein
MQLASEAEARSRTLLAVFQTLPIQWIGTKSYVVMALSLSRVSGSRSQDDQFYKQ